MSAADAAEALKGLPRLGDEALGECAFCRKVMLAAGLPVFYRFTVEHCGIDADAVTRHVGLAMAMGGGAQGLALAAAMGPRTEPVVVLGHGTINVCMACAQDKIDVVFVAGRALETETASDD